MKYFLVCDNVTASTMNKVRSNNRLLSFVYYKQMESDLAEYRKKGILRKKNKISRGVKRVRF